MKYVLLYTRESKFIVMCQQMPADTRPIYNPAIYEMVEFETEADMKFYIEDNNLEIVEVEDDN